MPWTSYPLPRSNSARYEPSWPVTPVMKARFGRLDKAAFTWLGPRRQESSECHDSLAVERCYPFNNLEADFPQMKLLHRYSPSCMQVLRQFLARVFCHYARASSLSSFCSCAILIRNDRHSLPHTSRA